MKEAIKAFLRGPGGTWLLANYFRFVRLTSRVLIESDHEPGKDGPVIYALWHGQSLVNPFRFPRDRKPHLLVAAHGDGQMIGQVMRRLGMPLIIGSGSTERTDPKKGGARAFLQMLRALRAGDSVELTADVPKAAGVVGEGIVLLARKSGRPIIPFAMTTSRHKRLNTWDRMQLNKPFSKMVFVDGPPISVPDDDSPLAAHQARLAEALNAAQARAFELAGVRDQS